MFPRRFLQVNYFTVSRPRSRIVVLYILLLITSVALLGFPSGVARYGQGLRADRSGEAVAITTVHEPADAALPMCQYPSEGLVGKVRPSLTMPPPTLSELSQKFPDVRDGHWTPSDCRAKHRVLLIIPFRDRWLHLSLFLNHYIPILQRQKIDFRIIVCEQNGTEIFNKGRVMNAAFTQAKKDFAFDCVIFHDIDAFLENDRNLYICPRSPRHLAPAVSRHNYTLKYSNLVGTALAFPRRHFEMMNGYSNDFWGWGGEDDEMSKRILSKGFRIERPNASVGRYTLIEHTKNKREMSFRIQQLLIDSAERRMMSDGLTSLRFSSSEKKQTTPLFVHYEVDVGKMDLTLHNKLMMRDVILRRSRQKHIYR